MSNYLKDPRPPGWVVPQALSPPPGKEAVPEEIERLIRVETRLVRLMAHLGLDQDGNPIKKTNPR